jgi:hypothetical protein
VDDFFIPVQWPGGAPVSPFLVGDRLAWAKGTLSRQAEIRAALRERFGEERLVTRSFAWLVREPQNAVSADAIAVYIGAHKIGFMPGALAGIFAPTIDGLAQRELGQPPLGHPSCLMTIQTVRDGAFIVGLIGPWPPNESRDEFWKPETAEPSEKLSPSAEVTDQQVASFSWRHAAITRMKRGMTREQLLETVGEAPGKLDERVTKTCTRHVMHFLEDPERNGRYLLKVTLEDGIVVSWHGARD